MLPKYFPTVARLRWAEGVQRALMPGGPTSFVYGLATFDRCREVLSDPFRMGDWRVTPIGSGLVMAVGWWADVTKPGPVAFAVAPGCLSLVVDMYGGELDEECRIVPAAVLWRSAAELAERLEYGPFGRLDTVTFASSPEVMERWRAVV